MKYQELKSYFAKNYKTLPVTLAGEGVFYSNVISTVKNYIKAIDYAIEHKTNKVQARAYIGNLKSIHKYLQVKKNWNVERKEWCKEIKFTDRFNS